jgi:hypothetical protein
MALATLAIEKSLVGQAVERIRSAGTIATMYVDDIVLSSGCISTLTEHYQELEHAICEANLKFSKNKCSPPGDFVEAFNCRLDHLGISILDDRMHRFNAQLAEANDFGRAAILRYVGVVNPEQAAALAIN